MEIEFQINKYVISKNRLTIGRILEIHPDKKTITMAINTNIGMLEVPISMDNILQCEKELIDIVKENDIVNGYTIEQITVDSINGKKKLLTGHWDHNWQGDGTLLQFYNEDIKTIETKERIEQDCYYIETDIDE